MLQDCFKFYYQVTKFKDILRQGAVQWRVDKERLESIAEHTFGCCVLAISLPEELKLPLNHGKVLEMLIIHELEELFIGDLTPLDNVNKEELRKNAYQKIKILVKDLNCKNDILALTNEFNEAKTLEAEFAKAVDKLECVLEFKKYQDNGQVSLDHVTDEIFLNIDTLINCAGQWTKGEISQLDKEHFAQINTLDRLKEIIDTNTFGTIGMISTIAPILIKNGKGQIININSQSGVETEEFCPVYNASKHGSYYYRKAIQRDLAKHNIKITDVCPGLIKTNFYIRANDKLPEEIMKLGLSSKDVANTVKYVFDLPHEITIPSIEVRNIKNY